MKALGAGLGAFALPRRRGRARDDSGAPVARAARRRRGARATNAACMRGSCRSRTPTRPRWPSCSRWAEAPAWNPSSLPTPWATPTGGPSPPVPRSRCSWTGRAAAVAWEVRRLLGGDVRAPGRAGLRQGQQRRRRSGRRRACSRDGGCARRVFELAAGIDPRARSRGRSRRPTSSSTRCTAPGSAVRSRATPHSWPTPLAGWSGPTVVGRHPVRGRRPERPDLRTDGARRRARSPSRRASPASCSSPVVRTPGEVVVVDIGIDVDDDVARRPGHRRRRARVGTRPRTRRAQVADRP